MSNQGRFVDALIYPICFNMRHSIELRLKGAIEEILKIAKLKDTPLQFDLLGSHDIGNIWKFFQRQSEALDKRYTKINATLAQTIIDISEVDATGQTFRYPIDINSKKHLTDIDGLINCHVLLIKFSELEKNLDTLHRFNEFLVSEYELGSFTRNISRFDLFQIAKKLPARINWGNEDFSKIKANIITEYGLSSNELTKAIDIIQSNYEMAFFIQKDLHLMGITEDQIVDLLGYWVKWNKNFRYNSLKENIFTGFVFNGFNDEIINEIKYRNRIEKETLGSLRKSLNTEYLAGLNALFYFADDLEFSENYKLIYNFQLNSAKVIENDEKEISNNFLHIFKKANMLDNFMESLYFLNFTKLAERIIKIYDLENLFEGYPEFLDNLRTGKTFRKPDIYGY